MPRHKPERRETAKPSGPTRWSRWLDDAMAETHTDTPDLITRAAAHGATFDKTNVSRWRSGATKPLPEHVVIVARVLERDPVEALQAAGHDVLAEAIADAAEREYRARIAEMDKEIEAKLARRKAAEGRDEDGAASQAATGPI